MTTREKLIDAAKSCLGCKTANEVVENLQQSNTGRKILDASLMDVLNVLTVGDMLAIALFTDKR